MSRAREPSLCSRVCDRVPPASSCSWRRLPIICTAIPGQKWVGLGSESGLGYGWGEGTAMPDWISSPGASRLPLQMSVRRPTGMPNIALSRSKRHSRASRWRSILKTTLRCFTDRSSAAHAVAGPSREVPRSGHAGLALAAGVQHTGQCGDCQRADATQTSQNTCEHGSSKARQLRCEQTPHAMCQRGYAQASQNSST